MEANRNRLAPQDELSALIGLVLPDGERVVYRLPVEDVLIRSSPKEQCKRHVLMVLNAFNVDLSAQLIDSLNDAVSTLEKPKSELSLGPAWIDPYLFPLVTDDDDAAVTWLMEEL